jgi:hypothetical protein
MVPSLFGLESRLSHEPLPVEGNVATYNGDGRLHGAQFRWEKFDARTILVTPL